MPQGIDLSKESSVTTLVEHLQSPDPAPVQAAGTWGSYAALLVTFIQQHLHYPILFVRAHIDDAEHRVDDLHTFGATHARVLPAWDGEEELADATDEIRAQRMRLVLDLLAQPDGSLVVAPIQA
ncbi:hypothetical protein ACFL6U_06545, partial [Planctomycetota bacterium]